LASHAFVENTGARGLVSAVEKALLDFERKLPSAGINEFPATSAIIDNPETFLKTIAGATKKQETHQLFGRLIQQEKENIKEYLKENQTNLADKYGLTMTPSRLDVVATCYAKNTLDIGKVIKKIKSYYDEIKKIELHFFKNHDINIVLEEDAIDFIIEKLIESPFELEDVTEKINQDFQHGLKLAREKTNRNRFFITRQALLDPEAFVGELIKDQIKPS
jgi:ATP-dependent protease Clp ATPase subunit